MGYHLVWKRKMDWPSITKNKGWDWDQVLQKLSLLLWKSHSGSVKTTSKILKRAYKRVYWPTAGLTGFYPSTFVYSHFPPKVQFHYCFLSSVALWGGPMVDTKENFFWNLNLQIGGKSIFLGFFGWILRVLWGFLKKRWLERYIQLFFMNVCKYLNQRVRIGE